MTDPMGLDGISTDVALATCADCGLTVEVRIPEVSDLSRSLEVERSAILLGWRRSNHYPSSDGSPRIVCPRCERVRRAERADYFR